LLTADFWTPVTACFADLDVTHADNGADDRISDMAARALAAAPGRFNLVAHAMGAFVAFEIMRRAPDRVLSLALCSTLAQNDTPAQTERRLGYARLVEEGRFDQVVEERIPILLHPDRRDDGALLGVVRRMAEQTGPERFLNQQRAIMTRIDSRPGLPAISCPTLIVAGRQDGIVTEAHQSDMRTGIPHAQFRWIDQCGHILTHEQPGAVGALLRDWLA
jgi:pimeloyl-ACP methyl ester carboxylesterase